MEQQNVAALPPKFLYSLNFVSVTHEENLQEHIVVQYEERTRVKASRNGLITKQTFITANI
jgi:hypothetical protein